MGLVASCFVAAGVAPARHNLRVAPLLAESPFGGINGREEREIGDNWCRRCEGTY